MSTPSPSERRPFPSYCVDDRCREEGPRHLHEPFGNKDAESVEAALLAELTPERVARRLAEVARLTDALATERALSEKRRQWIVEWHRRDGWCIDCGSYGEPHAPECSVPSLTTETPE